MPIYNTGARPAPPTARKSSIMGPFLIAAGVSLMIGVSAVFAIPSTLSIDGLINLAGLSHSLSQAEEITTSGIRKLVGDVASELEYLSERVETVATKTDTGLNRRVERIDGELAEVKKTVDDVAVNMEFLDLRVDRVARGAEQAPDGELLGLKKLIADLSAEVDSLHTRVEAAARTPEPDLSARMVHLDREIEALRAEIAALKADRTDWAKGIDDGLAAARIDIAGLRSTLDEQSTTNRKDIAALTMRLEKIESIIASRDDVTASIRPASARAAAKPRRRSSWVVEASNEGIAIVKGRPGRFEVKVGSILPGLGRITSIEQEGGRWVVHTPRGTVPFAN